MRPNQRASRRLVVGFGVLVVAQMATGCRSIVRQEPDPASVPVGFELRGRIEYDGDPRYLPRTLVAVSSEAAQPVATFRLGYRADYRHTSNAQILNPLLLFGGRFLGTDVTARATLEILANGAIVKRYERTCRVTLRRSVWVWESTTSSDLYRRAMAGARDLLDADLFRDRREIAAALESAGR